MSKFHRILCPVDLSENSFGAIELATALAKQYEAKVAFLYVSTLWLPDESRVIPEYSQYADDVIREQKAKLHEIRPTDPSVGFEHVYICGSPGATVVNATKTADIVVMSTHGRSGVMRFLMGSVAHYVLRNAKCAVVLVKGMEIEEGDTGNSDANLQDNVFVTEVLHPVSPIHGFDGMESALVKLKKARETAAPVVDGSGECIGILTTTDIERFHALQERFEAKDETVIAEVFEVDQYGQRRTSNDNFDKVERHMTKEVISIRDSETIHKAIELFDANPSIHHLVVLDEDRHAVGIVDVQNVVGVPFADPRQGAGAGQVSESRM